MEAPLQARVPRLLLVLLEQQPLEQAIERLSMLVAAPGCLERVPQLEAQYNKDLSTAIWDRAWIVDTKKPHRHWKEVVLVGRQGAAVAVVARCVAEEWLHLVRILEKQGIQPGLKAEQTLP
ncbi:hypothetical protein LPJ57_003416 [Coemansia sp. RSA 486]|nr:hypothetical protein LPJ57_003416 [Coemansia sp. RSA 486]